MANGRLDGKVALVTGGARGIGAAIVRRLAAEGADVALTYVSSANKADAVVDEVKAAGRRGLAIQADSAGTTDVGAAVDRTVATFGRLDILVNNAGVFAAGPLEDITVEDIDRTLNIHVRATLLASQAAAQHLPEGGRIVNIGSNLAERVPEPGTTLYSASKAGVTALTKGLARDLGPRGVTVNQVDPGSTDTDMNPAAGGHAEAQRERTIRGSFGSADDIASAVAYLASPEARTITGASLLVDGGANV